MNELEELKAANDRLLAEVFHMRKHMQVARQAYDAMNQFLSDGRVGKAHDALKRWGAQAQAIDGA
jgi:hypothetical protein